MRSRHSGTPTPARMPAVPIHRGPQAMPPASVSAPPFHHAPNAALLIDFDNVTMGIRSDLQTELRSLLSSAIIKGKVAVQRAYADWRRYPQYIVPLSESSIDLIFAPAYGSSKKNATDIRLAIDALELVFTRPEIGTFILLSGDSDFSSLVLKLKEYGKYVIGVGIRESSSDLLVQNCDEYYSYNALAGLVKTGEEELIKRDPWELVIEAVSRMKRNGDVMRSDRLKQVMQELDSTFDEKDLGMSKFSRFCLEAAHRGLLKVTKLENGQLEVDIAEGAGVAGTPGSMPRGQSPSAQEGERGGRPEERGRRPRGGRGRGRERGGRAPQEARTTLEQTPAAAATAAPQADGSVIPAVPAASAAAHAGTGGDRLTRPEAFDLVRRAVAALAGANGEAVLASDVRARARELLARDSESLEERNFQRILRDAHDADVVDLRRRGDDYEVAPATSVAPIAEQLHIPMSEEPSKAGRSAANAAALRRGMRHRGGAGRGQPAELPPELLALGRVDAGSNAETEEMQMEMPALTNLEGDPESPDDAESSPRDATGKPRSRTRRGGRGRGKAGSTNKPAPPTADAPAKVAANRPRARRKPASPAGDDE